MALHRRMGFFQSLVCRWTWMSGSMSSVRCSKDTSWIWMKLLTFVFTAGLRAWCALANFLLGGKTAWVCALLSCFAHFSPLYLESHFCLTGSQSSDESLRTVTFGNEGRDRHHEKNTQQRPNGVKGMRELEEQCRERELHQKEVQVTAFFFSLIRDHLPALRVPLGGVLSPPSLKLVLAMNTT